MQTEAIILEQPGRLAIDRLALCEPAAGDVVVATRWSGVSTGTEKLFWQGTMPWFPGHGYPLVPGYEGVGDVIAAGPDAGVAVGSRVVVPGANCFEGARALFGASAAKVVLDAGRVAEVDPSFGSEAVLLPLAATAQHAISGSPHAGQTLIVGHGVVGRLLARLLIARGDPAPIVWETNPARRSGAKGYDVVAPEDDPCGSHQTIFDASGDSSILDQLVARLAPQGEIVLAGFYSEPLSFNFPPAFMREARLRIAAQWQPADMSAVSQHLQSGTLSLGGLITHHQPASAAASAYPQAFDDPNCLKMVLDWSAAE